MKTRFDIQLRSAVILMFVLLIQIMSTVSAGDLVLSTSPLFLTHNIPPNLLIILDNSKSTDYEIMAKPHWERAAYEYSFASGEAHRPTPQDKSVARQPETCINPDGDCGVWREDGAITLSGPNLANAKGCTAVANCNVPIENLNNPNDSPRRNYLSYNYLSTCWNNLGTLPCRRTSYNMVNTNCTNNTDRPNVFSLANCPETEGLDWRVRSAALNAIYYNPNIDYKPWKLLDDLKDAIFTAARSNPDQNKTGYDYMINLGLNAPLGIDPTSCTTTDPKKPCLPCKGGSCAASDFKQGFVYYVWEDDKGFPSDDKRPRRGVNNNMTNTGNGIVDLWDTHYKVTVGTDSMTVEKITCSNAYYAEDDANRKQHKGSLVCNTENMPNGLPVEYWNKREVATSKEKLDIKDEQQNIANWFQYYRRRLLTIKAFVAEMPYIAPNYRYGLMTMFSSNLNKLVVVNDGIEPKNFLDPSEQLLYEFPKSTESEDDQLVFTSQQHNKNMIKALFKSYYFEDTPMRETLNQAGQYYQYSESPNRDFISRTTVDPIVDKKNGCQRNNSLVITDGYYTTDNNPIINDPGISDSDKDGTAVTLADVARYYYVNDLRSKIPDKLPETPRDNAKHQHMVTFGISLGVEGKIELNDTNGDGWPDKIVNPPSEVDWSKSASSLWGNPLSSSCRKADQNGNVLDYDCPEKIDDLWHAAYNSHGNYTFAEDPEKLRQALMNVLAQISPSRTAAAATSSSSFYTAGSFLFRSSFESKDWTGDLKAFTLEQAPVWSAAEELNNIRYDDREILTYDPENHQGIPFQWGSLSDNQQQDLNSQLALVEQADGNSILIPDPDCKDSNDKNCQGKGRDRVDFLRGKGAGTGANKEKDNKWFDKTLFRERPGVLGDIIQSEAVYVDQPFFRYNEYGCAECSKYADFKATSRTPMVYVGANDGMLHGFDARDGKEKIAYVPNRLINKLGYLTQRDYTHQYYADGSATVSDAYFNGTWHTVLVGSLRAGGQSIFALDITDPSAFSEANSSTVLWEFGDHPDYGDPDLGNTFSRPIIARLRDGANEQNGKWYVIFGNGYNNTFPDGDNENRTQRDGKDVVSKTGEAVLYIVPVNWTGQSDEIIKISTKAGKRQDPDFPPDDKKTKPHKNARPNGLATPAVVDIDDDLKADFIYAGDLYGNLWKFDVRNSDPGAWQNQKPVQLFKAVDSNGKSQPITVSPVVNFHPLGRDYGFMIYFGTGKYFEKNDNVYDESTIQSFYGIWDISQVTASQQDPKPLKPVTVFDRSQLFEQQLSLSGENSLLRTTTSKSGEHSIQWLDKGKQNQKGWFMDLSVGEKQITDPTIRNKRVIFTTLVLPEDRQSCDFDGSSSWLMVVSGNDGGSYTEGNFVDLDKKVIGIKSTIGILPTPNLIYKGDLIRVIASGTTGETLAPPPNDGDDDDGEVQCPGGICIRPSPTGRQSWR